MMRALFVGLSVWLVLSSTILCSGCATSERYVWGRYDTALYAYYKNPKNIDKLKNAVAEAIKDGERKNHVAPGLYAEYGYLLLEGGDLPSAKALFEKEKQKWPESAILMDRVMADSNKAPEQIQAKDATEQPPQEGAK